MKITIEPYSGGEYTSSSEAEYIGEVVEMFKGLLVASGYHPTTVDEFLPTDTSWFRDPEIELLEAPIDIRNMEKKKQ
jgi:hypothetical protein